MKEINPEFPNFLRCVDMIDVSEMTIVLADLDFKKTTSSLAYWESQVNIRFVDEQKLKQDLKNSIKGTSCL